MSNQMNRARSVILGGLAAVAFLTGCDRLKTELLAPQNPGLVDPSAVASPAAALALRVGAIGRYKQVQAGESIWQMGGTLADEYKNADFSEVRIAADKRITDPLISWNYGEVTRSRGYVRDAIRAMKAYTPDSSSLIGELYMELAFLEMTLADNYCNGIPLGHTENGIYTNGVPITAQQVYDSASAHLDSALMLSTGTDVGSVYVNRAARVFKGRVLTNQGKYATAATFVSTASIPTTYQYDMTFSATSGSNGMWVLNNSTARISVADSFDLIGGAQNVIKNALPFASANDPRVPVINGDLATPKVLAVDGVTKPFYLGLLYKGNFDPLVLASGIDARLIEAEAKLNAPDIPGMMAILNALRTATPRPAIGITSIAAMPAIATTPATQVDAVTLFFREKAFWTFGRGQRLPDLRRLIRQYNRTQDQVFPTGIHFKGGTYGTDVNFPVPTVEQANPLFSACIDRKA